MVIKNLIVRYFLSNNRKRKKRKQNQTKQNQTTMSNDKNACTNSLGVRGKIVSKRVEVRESASLTEEQVAKVPTQVLHCVKTGLIPSKQPVIKEVDYDVSSRTKKVTYQKEKHTYHDSNEKGKSREYTGTVITQEQYPEPISEHEMNCLTKCDLLDKINKAVDNLDLKDFTSKGDILKFANGPGYISNTEKKRRAVALMKKVNQFLQDNHKKELGQWKVNEKNHKKNGSGEAIPKLERIRVTSSEIASL